MPSAAILESNQGQIGPAVTDAKHAISLDPSLAAAYRAYGYILGSQRRFGDAIREFDRALALDPGDADSRADRGAALSAMGRYDAAKVDFDRAIAIDPRQSVATRGRAMMLLKKGQYQQAADAFSKALEVTPEDPAILFYRSRAYRLNHQDALAQADIDAVTRQDPLSAEPHKKLARWFDLEGDLPAAISQLDEAVQIAPDDLEARKLRETALRRNHQ